MTSRRWCLRKILMMECSLGGLLRKLSECTPTKSTSMKYHRRRETTLSSQTMMTMKMKNPSQDPMMTPAPDLNNKRIIRKVKRKLRFKKKYKKRKRDQLRKDQSKKEKLRLQSRKRRLKYNPKAIRNNI